MGAIGCGSNEPNSSEAVSRRDGPPNPPIADIPRAIVDGFALFRRPASRRDRLPLGPHAEELRERAGVPGENYALARRLDPPAVDKTVYVWPGSQHLCYSHVGGAACVRLSVLEHRGASFGVSAGSSVGRGITRISGLVHDGVSQVALITPMRVVRFPVRHNALLKDIRGRVLRVRWRYGKAEHTANVALPPLAAGG
jgi:hypothetical protein